MKSTVISDVDQAAEVLANGDVLGMPTETVYGLAARIDSETGIRRIFSVKERPFFDPLIVHVESVVQAKSLVKTWPAVAEALAKRFWPGPLTMVIEKSELVSDLITSGRDSVGLRMPNHPLALELIRKVGVPLAAPSANKFGKTSPTTASHVLSEFDSEGIQVLDGGSCEVGIESTVLLIQDLQPLPKISVLRKGQILKSQIIAALEGLEFEYSDDVTRQSAPGQMKHHYMPSVPLIVALDSRLTLQEMVSRVKAQMAELPDEIDSVKIIRPPSDIRKIEFLKLNQDPTIATREFYSKLRQMAARNPDLICLIKLPLHSGEHWEPLFERIEKAASLILS